MREIVVDTETTGFYPGKGDRLVEVGCVELINRFPTGRTFHRYCNPDRDMPAEAFAIHGLSAKFLSGHPRFGEIADDFLAFIGDAALVAHNAAFDLEFLNAELERGGKPKIDKTRIIDTLMIARRKHPSGNKLDELCKRYKVDASRRTKHGALLDAELLAEVYIAMTVARQGALGFNEEPRGTVATGPKPARVRSVPLAARLSNTDRAAHRAFIATLGDKAIWQEYLSAA